MTARLLGAYRAWRINRHAERQEDRAYRSPNALTGWPLRTFKSAELRDALAADIHDTATRVEQ